MILFIDLEHPGLEESRPRLWEEVRRKRARSVERFSQLSGKPCHMIAYHQFEGTPPENTSHVVISGNNADATDYTPESIAALMQLLRHPTHPTLAICGSFQLMAQAHGIEIGPIGPLEPGEPPHEDPLKEGMKQEKGFLKIRIIQKGRIFENIDSPAVFAQNHYWEIKGLAPSFDWLATSTTCPFQAIKIKDQPVWGTQFHPEEYDDRFPAGKTLLQNFFNSN